MLRRFKDRTTTSIQRAAEGSSPPAGTERPAPGERPRTTTRERRVMRRRLREIRREREALILELGELSLAGHQGDVDRGRFRGVAASLEALDTEARGLLHALRTDDTLGDVVTAGVTGHCSRCHALVPRHAAYCQRCGEPTGQKPLSIPAPPLTARPAPQKTPNGGDSAPATAATNAGTAQRPSR